MHGAAKPADTANTSTCLPQDQVDVADHACFDRPVAKLVDEDGREMQLAYEAVMSLVTSRDQDLKESRSEARAAKGQVEEQGFVLSALTSRVHSLEEAMRVVVAALEALPMHAAAAHAPAAPSTSPGKARVCMPAASLQPPARPPMVGVAAAPAYSKPGSGADRLPSPERLPDLGAPQSSPLQPGVCMSTWGQAAAKCASSHAVNAMQELRMPSVPSPVEGRPCVLPQTPRFWCAPRDGLADTLHGARGTDVTRRQPQQQQQPQLRRLEPRSKSAGTPAGPVKAGLRHAPGAKSLSATGNPCAPSPFGKGGEPTCADPGGERLSQCLKAAGLPRDEKEAGSSVVRGHSAPPLGKLVTPGQATTPSFGAKSSFGDWLGSSTPSFSGCGGGPAQVGLAPVRSPGREIPKPSPLRSSASPPPNAPNLAAWSIKNGGWSSPGSGDVNPGRAAVATGSADYPAGSAASSLSSAFMRGAALLNTCSVGASAGAAALTAAPHNPRVVSALQVGDATAINDAYRRMMSPTQASPVPARK